MASSGSKRALVVGVDTYENLSVFDHLEGCVNDARLMAQLLRDRFGFPEEHVTLLTDAEATRDGILAAMDALADATAEDDIVVMFFAGHGSQMTCREGDEPDGLDETIVPYDTGRANHPDAPGSADDTNRDISDDEINVWLRRVTAKTSYVTLLFDCCHSGTIARDTFGAKARYLAPDTRPVEELPPSPIPHVVTRGTRAEVGPSGWLPLSDRYVLIAGCADDECSYEYRDPETDTPHGALTFFLARAFADARPGTTYRDIYERVCPSVNAHASKQHPQLEGALDRELFGIRTIEPMRFVGVEKRDGPTVTLAAGAAQGLTVGSEWDVYPAGTKTTDDATPIGRVRVTHVGAVASKAELMEESADGVEPGARAVEALHAAHAAGLRVHLSVPDGFDEAAQALTAELDKTPLVTVVGDVEPADARAYLLVPRADDDGPVPQLGAVAEASWAVVGSTDGRLLMRVHPVSKAGVARLLRDNFVKIARYRFGLALDNPDPHSTLRGALDVRLQKKQGSEWADATPDAGGRVVFAESDRLAFTITNNHTEPLYVYALDFDITHGIYPLTVQGANETLAPGNTLKIGYPDGIAFEFDDAFPFAPQPNEADPIEGTETLKVFGTTQPADFSSFNQEPTRSSAFGEAEGGSSLQQLIRRAALGAPTRKIALHQKTTDDGDWTTASRSFMLRKETASATLDAGGSTAALGDITIRTRGLGGEARVLPPLNAAPAGTRSAPRIGASTGVLDGLHAVLAQERVGAQQTVEIDVARTRSLPTPGAEPTIEVEVPEPDAGHGQFVLYTDESGVTTWQFAKPAAATRSLGPRTRRYVIDRAAPVAPEGAATRGIAGAVGKKLIEVLVFPLIDPLIGAVTEKFAEKWEEKERPYGLRPFTPANYTSPDAPALGDDDWRRLGAGRSLLFVHGTFSRSHSAFGALGTETLAALSQRYDGRVFAFDHFTLSHDPRRNIEEFLARLPDDAALDVDIVCHSRGGLVSRMLAEKQSAFSLGARTLRVGNVVFVASPNAGTSLADPEHMGTLVDTYTNLLNLVPDNPVTDVLDGVVTVAKLLAVGALSGLSGLQSMRPGGDFQQWLNAGGTPGETTYYALGADFTPSHRGMREWAKDRLMDAVFGAENDLVVPTASVYEANGSGLFPIAEHHVFDAHAAISHAGFFQHPKVQEKLLAWLTA
ncbi:MAG: caspase family protein [Rhodothermales bacterium]